MGEGDDAERELGDEDEVDDDGGVVGERADAAETFELVAHETRIGVLEVLRAADGGPLPFGEIRAAVGVDDPGQCHYHVDRLVGRFVEKTDDGYVLSPAGWRVVGALVSGGLTASLAPGSVSASGSCSECGGGLIARFRAGGVAIECVDCGFVQTNPDVPTGALAGWSEAAVPRVVGRYMRLWEVSGSYGFCPNCECRVDRAVRRPGEGAEPGRPAAPDWFDDDGVGDDGGRPAGLLVTACRECGFWWHAALPIAALVEPAVIAFHHEHDIDLRERPWWTLDHLDIGAASISEDPRRVAIPMTIDGDSRTFVFDGDFSFVEERRR